MTPPPAQPCALVVARLLPYKRVDLALRACALAGIPLTVVGDGPAREQLEALGIGATFVGRVTDEELAALFVKHSVILVPGVEDFGYLPVEAAYAGRPVVAYAGGGALETVTDRVTGRLVSDQEPTTWARELTAVLERPWSPTELRTKALEMRSEAFELAVHRWLEPR